MAGMTAIALVPVFFGLTLGYFAGRRGIVPYENVTGLNTFLLSYAVPAALFLAAAQTPRQILALHGRLFLVITLSMVALFFGGLLVEVKLFKFSPADSSALLLAVSAPNWVGVGFPLYIGLYGPQSTMPVAVAVLCGNLVIVPLTLLLLESGNSHAAPASILRRYLAGFSRCLKKAIVLAPALGLCFSLAGYSLPAVWVRSLGFYAETVAGVSLFVTGVVLSRESIHLDLNVFGGTLLKLAIQPLLAFVIASHLMGLPTPVVRDAVLLMACPSGFFGILFAVAYQARTREAASVLLLSSAGSALTLSIIVPLLPLIR
ncbi:MAG: AEC family transporter [Candidatus Korobacteraceae bacterium]